MKSIIWKIGAVATIILGSLGPQVAHGNWSEAPVAAAEEQSGPALEVISYQSGTAVTVGQTAECGQSTFNIERLDLLLWHNCNFSIKLGRISSPKLTVVTELPNLPTVSVLRSEPNQLAGHSEFWTDHTKATAAFINHTVLITGDETSNNQDHKFATFGYGETLTAATDSTQEHIVMRC